MSEEIDLSKFTQFSKWEYASWLEEELKNQAAMAKFKEDWDKKEVEE